MRALIFVALAACSFPPLDMQGGSDGMTGGTRNACGQLTSFPGTTTNQAADHYPNTQQEPEELDYAADFTGGQDAVFISLVANTSLFNNNVATGTFSLTGAEANVQTCGACVVVAGNCNNCNPFSGDGTGTYYVATAGSLMVSSISGTMTGTLSNAMLEHVTITVTSNSLSQSVASDGCQVAVPTLSFSGAITNH